MQVGIDFLSWDRSPYIVVTLCIKICNARWDRLSKRWDRLTFTIVSLYASSGDRFSMVADRSPYIVVTLCIKIGNAKWDRSSASWD